MKYLEKYLPGIISLGIGFICILIAFPLTLLSLSGTYIYDKINGTNYYNRLKDSMLNPYKDNNKKKILVFK